jgi:hypothetical protein
MAKKSKSRFTAEVDDDDDDWIEEKAPAPAPEAKKPEVKPVKLPPNHDLMINVPAKPEED